MLVSKDKDGVVYFTPNCGDGEGPELSFMKYVLGLEKDSSITVRFNEYVQHEYIADFSIRVV